MREKRLLFLDKETMNGFNFYQSAGTLPGSKSKVKSAFDIDDIVELTEGIASGALSGGFGFFPRSPSPQNTSGALCLTVSTQKKAYVLELDSIEKRDKLLRTLKSMRKTHIASLCNIPLSQGCNPELSTMSDALPSSMHANSIKHKDTYR